MCEKKNKVGELYMKKTNSILIILLYFTLIFLIASLLMPKSVLGFYQAHALSNIYIPNLGIDSGVGVNIKSIVAYPALIRVLFLICDTSTLATIRIAGFSSVLAILFSYILLFRVVAGDKKTKILVAWIYPIIFIFLNSASIVTGYIFGFSTILSFIIVFFFLDKRRQQNYIPLFIIALISWIALGLFWHTLQVMTYFIILSYMFISSLPDIIKTGNSTIKWNLFILLTVIFIATWIYLREDALGHVLNNPNIDISSLFKKGSFAGTYSFKSALPIEWIDKMRYFGYIFAYVLMGIIAIKFIVNIFRKKEVSSAYIIVTALLISGISFMLLYFIASGTTLPRILLTFSYPFLLILLNSKSGLQIDFINKYNLKKIFTLVLVIPIALTSTCTLYTYIVETPEKNLSIEMYRNSFFWIVDHSHPKRILSDSHTSGHYQILYTSCGIYRQYKMDASSIGSDTYKRILEIEYKNVGDSILVINTELYKKHLIFSSLQAWNKFEPIPPQCVTQNKQLNIVYDDGRILIAQ